MTLQPAPDSVNLLSLFGHASHRSPRRRGAPSWRMIRIFAGAWPRFDDPGRPGDRRRSFAPPASAQQGPSPAAAAPGRPQDSPRGTGSGTPDLSASRHPLDPLEPAEIAAAVAAIRKERQLADSVRFVTVTLKEPSKEVVPPVAARRRVPARGVRDPARQGDRPGLRGGRRPPHRRGAAVRGTARGRPAADHARGVRRVRGGGPASRRSSARR